jgi:periplasmic divalent cation tolerance protein
VELIVVMITTASPAEARSLGDALLEARLVACVNLVEDVRSFYWWRGEREVSDECLLMAKTRRELLAPIVETVRRLHSYEVFEAVALPIAECAAEYGDWVRETTAAARTG